MRTLTTLFVVLSITWANNKVHAQDSTKMAKVYFVRSTGYEGSLLTFHCFVDSTLMCGLSNNQYSTHFVTPGKHVININAHSKKFTNNNKSLTISAEAGQSYYIKIMPVQGYDNKVKSVAVAETTIRPIINKCELKTNCLD